jgi:iron complex transport system ATP-binding protein
MTTLIEARELTYRVDGRPLVSGVSLAAEVGELIAVVGPNSAGKSTLLRLLSGELSPKTGSVTIDGMSISGAPPGDLALRRSYLGQQPPLDVPFTVREVVAMGRHPHRTRPGNTAETDQAAVASALATADIAELAARVYATLSGGEAQRVNVARILAQDAPVVLLDEPTAALDIGHRQVVMASLRAVAARGGAVITVLHDLNLAATFADRLLLLHRGETAAVGRPAEVLTEETLSPVYGHPVRVIQHPFRDSLLVLP